MLGDDRPNQSDQAGKGSAPSRRDLLKTATGVVAATVVGGALLEASKGTAAAAGNNGTGTTSVGDPAFTFTIHGATQGQFPGDPGQTGNAMLGYAFQEDTGAPIDPISGLPTGRRQHKPIVITKEWDASSPKIFQALNTNEVLEVTILFGQAQTNIKGIPGVEFKMQLSNAQVIDQKLYINAGDTDRLEDVSLTYQKLVFSMTQGAT
ncbi:MAG TPA: type VI secretion system tube protein TssD [Thermomicrobiaceae bacterium]|nr:type VI secretion system tube protein TssD [Thermomicrobiaceae bacterium]